MSAFTASQLKRLLNIFDNAGQVFLGSLVVSPIVSVSNPRDLALAISAGTSLTLFLWWILLRLERISS